jgi:hypothetical protein
MPATPAVADPRGAVVAKRISFVSEPPQGARVCREFARAYSRTAIEEVLDAAALSADRASPLSAEDLTVLLIPVDAAAEGAKLSEAWIAEDGAAAATLSVAVGAQRIKWRPGRAIVQGPAASFDRTLEALTGFAFYEGELRRLEEALDEHEAQTQADVARAQVIRFRDRSHWRRLTELSERFWRMRLVYARLASDLAGAPRGLPPETKQLINRLLDQADVAARLEAVSDRLEACEDLYDGATDRIAEYRWFVASLWLETSIVVLLLIEIGLLSAELYLVHFK